MMAPRVSIALMLLALALAWAPVARAGSACSARPLTAATFTRALALAERTGAALDGAGARVALVARAGQDLSKYGLRFSHMAYAVRRDGQWVMLHELNDCGSASSSLFDEGLGRFFLDDMHVYEARIVVPGAALQARLLATLDSNAPLALHEARYNMLAYPFATAYQNSNQWLLETLAAALAAPRTEPGTGQGNPAALTDRAQAQAWLKGAGYRPITVEIDAMTRLGARLTRANIAFEDQPFERRMAGHIDTVTVDSVVRFVRMRDGGATVIDVGL